MSRVIYYSNSILTAEQLSQSEVYTMLDLGFVFQAAMGSANTAVTGLACTPTSTPSLSVQIDYGALFKQNSIDVIDFGPLSPNSNAIVKIAIHNGPTTLTEFDRTLSIGESIDYLIEANFLEKDDTPEIVQYYNKNDPTSPFYGVNDSGASQYTIRRTTVSLNVIKGQSDTTGSQVTPSPTSGWLPLWVITIAYGQNYIDSASIKKADGSNFAEDRLVPYAKLNSPSFIGNPQAPTISSTNISNSIATTSFVNAFVNKTLETYATLANVSTSVANLATYASNTYAPIANATLTGVPHAPTANSNTNTTQIATTAFVEQQINYVAAVPPGAIFYFASTFLPDGYLICDGSLVSRTTYATLYATIGTTFGQGDGIRTFQLPDLSGQFIRSWDSKGLVDPYRLMGSKQADAMQGHFHSIQDVWPKGTGYGYTGTTGVGSGAINTTGGPIADTTHGVPRIASETRPVNIALVACIKT